jgi:hypothetical protein
MAFVICVISEKIKGYAAFTQQKVAYVQYGSADYDDRKSPYEMTQMDMNLADFSMIYVTRKWVFSWLGHGRIGRFSNTGKKTYPVPIKKPVNLGYKEK